MKENPAPIPIDPRVSIGHVHLKVADIPRALNFYCDILGFELQQMYGDQAAFISAGGYHHHIGANVWHSRGAGKRDLDRSGLGWVELNSKDGIAKTVSDPWGTEVRVVPA